MILFALLLASAPSPLSIGTTLRVPPADFRGLHLSIKNRPATLDLQFTSQGGTGVRLILMPQSEESRFRAGRTPQHIAVTEFDRSGRLRSYIATPGEYSVVVDNRVELRHAVTVALKGTLNYDTAPKEARYLSTRRRVVVIASSLLFFFGVAWFAGRRLWRATAVPGGMIGGRLY